MRVQLAPSEPDASGALLAAKLSTLGLNHPDTLTSVGSLASTYRDQGRWDEAEKLSVEVMETRKTKLGADHPDTLTSMANEQPQRIFGHLGCEVVPNDLVE